MNASRGSAPPLAGFLVINKPLGLSSMQVVANVRARACADALTGKSLRPRTGHAGTLDPLATGVLVLAIGPATRLLSAIIDTDKKYLTTIDLSAFTSTDDAEYQFVPLHPARYAHAPDPPSRIDIPISSPPTRQHVLLALRSFTGSFLQTPPSYSAIKIHGRRAYARARQGESLSMPPRSVTVHALSLIDYAFPLLTLAIHCEKGFYVRAFARELGQLLHTGGFCRSIHRTAVGPFTIDSAIPLDQLPDQISQSDLIPASQLQHLLHSPRSP